MLIGYPLQFSTNALIGAGRILLLNNICFSTRVCRPMLSAVSCSRLAGTLLIECGMAREPGTDGERDGGRIYEHRGRELVMFVSEHGNEFNVILMP